MCKICTWMFFLVFAVLIRHIIVRELEKYCTRFAFKFMILHSHSHNIFANTSHDSFLVHVLVFAHNFVVGFLKVFPIVGGHNIALFSVLGRALVIYLVTIRFCIPLPYQVPHVSLLVCNSVMVLTIHSIRKISICSFRSSYFRFTNDLPRVGTVLLLCFRSYHDLLRKLRLMTPPVGIIYPFPIYYQSFVCLYDIIVMFLSLKK